MADRYWVGGSATWDATAGSKWALTSGGAGGQAVPTSSDNVFLDAASGAVTVTVSGTRTCANFDCTGFTGTFSGASTPILQVSGNYTLSTGMTYTAVTPVVTQILTTSNVNLQGKTIASFTVNAPGATVTLTNTLRCTTLTLTAGTLTVGANDVFFSASCTMSGSSTRVLNMGSGTWYSTSIASPTWTFTGTNITVNKETCIAIECLGSITGQGTVAFIGNAKSFPPIKIKAVQPGWGFNFQSEDATVASLEVSVANAAHYGRIIFESPLVITLGAFVRGTPALRIENSIISSTGASVVCTSGSVDFGNAFVRQIAASGGATFTGVDSVDAGANSGITFSHSGGGAAVKQIRGLHCIEGGI